MRISTLFYVGNLHQISPGNLFLNSQKLKSMSYSVDKLASMAECDNVLNRANQEKAILDHKLAGLVLDTSASLRTTAQNNADLVSVNAQIAGFTAALNALSDGPDKEEMASKIRRLNDRKDNLEERISKSGNSGLLLMEMQRGMLEKQVTELTSFIDVVGVRKAALN